MKGNASTSLMKTLISKKPACTSTSTAIQASKTFHSITDSIGSIKSSKQSNLNNLTDTLAIEESSLHNKVTVTSPLSRPVSPLSTSSSCSKTPPIGAKFALNMLGLNANSQSRIDLNVFQTHKSTASTSSDLNNFDASLCDEPNETAEISTFPLTDTNSLKNETDLKISARKNNVLLKKLLLEGGNSNEKSNMDSSNGFHSSNMRQADASPTMQTENSSFQFNDDDLILSKDSASKIDSNTSLATNNSNSNMSSKSNGNKRNATKTNAAYKSKDDIILRALLNISDIEPQLIELESVFDMNNHKSNNLTTNGIKKESLLNDKQNHQQKNTT
jgi:hypothetical protein